MKNHPRTAGALAAMTLAVVALSGCGNIDAATGASADFEKFALALPNVIAATGGGTNDMPWAGTVRGEVTVSQDITEGHLEAIVDTLGEYYADHDRGTIDWNHMRVRVDDYTLEIEKKKTTNDLLRDLFDDIRGSSVYAGGEVGIRGAQFVLDGEQSTAALIAGLDAAVIDVADHPLVSGGISVEFELADGSTSAKLRQGTSDPRPDIPIAAFEAVSATTALTYADVSNYSFYVILADEAAVPAARTLVTELLVGSDVDDVRVEGAGQ